MTYQSHTPESVVQFEKIGQIAITVTDLARARDFYLNTLGMRFLFDAHLMHQHPTERCVGNGGGLHIRILWCFQRLP